jgi:hypothetical protein
MSATLSLTEDQTYTAMRAFLLGLLPAGVEVIVGQDNRVAEPTASDFVVMTTMLQERIETNVVTYEDGLLTDPVSGVGKRFDMTPKKVTIQLDVHGPSSGDNVNVIASMFRSDYAVDAFAATGFDVTPLYASEPHQGPFVNGEQQVEQCWICDAVVQCNPIVTTGQQFAAAVTIGVINVDTTYLPRR